jgi:TolB-like protein/tetratricopeptide (TPR) repeat protein
MDKWQSSIAVLPFVNLSNEPESEYFAEGMSDEIRSLLGKIPDLRVIGRKSSHFFKGKTEDLRIIGEKLGVSSVLEGTVRRSGSRVRITPELINTASGDVIWTDTYDRKMTDIFAVQDDVAADVMDALQIHIGIAPTRGRPTGSPEAYALFLRARVLLDAQQGDEAIPLLQQAIDLDASYAEAIELLAFSIWQQGGSSIDIAESQERTFEIAARALAIDTDLTLARALYELTSTETNSNTRALELLEQAWREQPSNSAPLRALIYELTYMGYLREAHQFAVEYVQIDPLSPVANYSLGESFVALGQASEAIPLLQLSLELDNDFAKWFIPAFELLEGRDESAIALYEAELKRIGISDTTWVRDLLTAARDPVSGQAYLDLHIPQIPVSFPEKYALHWKLTFDSWYLLFGYLDRFYEKLFAAGPDEDTWSNAGLSFWQGIVFRRTEFTSHPRYLEAAESLGMFEIWEMRGPPDFCEKVAGDWVCN